MCMSATLSQRTHENSGKKLAAVVWRCQLPLIDASSGITSSGRVSHRLISLSLFL